VAELRRQARNLSFDQVFDPSFGCEILDRRVLEKYVELRGMGIKPILTTS